MWKYKFQERFLFKNTPGKKFERKGFRASVHVKPLKKNSNHETALHEGGISCIFQAKSSLNALKILYLFFVKSVRFHVKYLNVLDPTKN